MKLNEKQGHTGSLQSSKREEPAGAILTPEVKHHKLIGPVSAGAAAAGASWPQTQLK